jgi:hypothetical protein
MAFERKSDQLLKSGPFYLRLFKHMWIAFGLVILSIGFGASCYRAMEEMSWVDAVYNASMILTGMGPVSKLENDSTKIFASLYAIYGGVILLAITGIVLAPIAHRILHLFHLQEND